MTDQEPEYRRRIRQKAEQDERKSQEERDKAAQDSNANEIVGAIKSLGEKIDRQADENTPQKKRERLWHHLEVIGLWAAAAVGVIAVYTASQDASQQKGVMQGQLNEMRSQRLLTIQQLSAKFRRDTPTLRPVKKDGNIIQKVGEPIAGWSINPTFVNVGGTDARDVKSTWQMGWLPRKNDPSGNPQYNCPTSPSVKKVIPVTIPPGGGHMEAAKFITAQTVKDILAGTKLEYMAGTIEYRDVFPTTPTHHMDWCLVVVPNDPANSQFSFLIVRDIAS